MKEIENTEKDSTNLALIRKGNKLIESKYSLTLNQQRILADLLNNISSHDEDFKDYRIDILKIAKKHALDASKSIYQDFKKSIEDMLTLPLTFTQEENVFVVAWLASAKYKKGHGYVDVSFHPDLKPLLLFLKSHYTEYPAIAIQKFKCSYSFRFYEWLQSFRYKGSGDEFYRTFSIKELREKMEISSKQYKLFADFRRFVIEPALAEIDRFSDLNIVAVEYIKTARAVTEIKITARVKATAKKGLPDALHHTNQAHQGVQENGSNLALESTATIQQTDSADIDIHMDVKVDMVAQLQQYGVGQQTAQKWLNQYGQARIERNVAYVLEIKKTSAIKNFNAYLARAIMDDLGEAWIQKATQEKKAQEEKKALEQAQKAQEALERKQAQAEYQFYQHAFEQQHEMLQDIVLDSMENIIHHAMGAAFAAQFVKKRALAQAHTQPMFFSYLKQAMHDNGMMDDIA